MLCTAEWYRPVQLLYVRAQLAAEHQQDPQAPWACAALWWHEPHYRLACSCVLALPVRLSRKVLCVWGQAEAVAVGADRPAGSCAGRAWTPPVELVRVT